jgi:hypothetical protein
MKVRKNASDTCAMLSEAYGGKAMKKSSVFEWYKRFKEGHDNMEDYVRSGHPRTHRLMKMLKNVESGAFN